jgi:hypothetical protein
MRTTASCLIPIVAVSLASLAWSGCASYQGPDQPSRPGRGGIAQIEPFETRVDVIHGRTLVVPVNITGGSPPASVRVRLDDGREIEASVHHITVAPEAEATQWLAPAGVWSVSRGGGVAQADQGWWVLAIDLPHDAFDQGLNVNVGGGARHRIALNWFLDPSLMPMAAMAWHPPFPGLAQSPDVLALSAAEGRSPVRRWRHRLLIDGLSPVESAPAPFEDSVLEALAQQIEARWTLGLGMLWRADSAVAERLRRRLAAIVEFPGGEAAPAWPLEHSVLEALLADLLNPELQHSQRAERATAWLEALPAAAAWIIDDSGLRDAATGAPIATVGVANLGSRDVVISAGVAGDPASMEMRPIPTFSARTLAPAIPATAEDRTAAMLRTLSFAAGRWSANRTVLSGMFPISPPGMRLEPLIPDWTLEGWLAGAPDAAMRTAPAWSTRALLYYRASEQSPGGAVAGGAWTLYLECSAPERDEQSDEVTIWIGPFGSPVSVLRITRDGDVIDTLAAGNGRMAATAGATVVQLPDRWIASVPIDSQLIDPAGELLIGLVRIDSRGVRSAWPRPMLPWQREPGRLTIDTKAWGDIVPPETVRR